MNVQVSTGTGARTKIVNPPFDVAYGRPADSPLQGLDGTAVVPAAHQVTNARAGWCGVGWFDSARNGSVIIRAKRPFDTSVAPQAAWFTVTASGGAVTVTGAAFDPADPHELKLTLDRAFEADETATVSYRRPPDARGLWSADGYQLADLADATVTMTAAPGTGPGADGVVRRHAGMARRAGQRVQLRARVQRELRRAPGLPGAEGAVAAGDQRAGDGCEARGPGPQRPLDGHRAAAVGPRT